jgi:two-component system phosphate regulon sensor histidine kinase PhoR
MKQRHLLWQIYPTYLLVALVSLLLVGVYMVSAIVDVQHAHVQRELQAVARLAAQRLGDLPAPWPPDRVDAICKRMGGETGYRFTVVLGSGEVIGDTEESPAAMENHASRPEVRQARGTGVGVATRFSATRRVQLMYVAIPVTPEGTVVRASLPIRQVDDAVVTLRWRLLGAFGVVAVLAVGVSWFMSRRIRVWLQAVRTRVSDYGHGDLSHKMPTVGIAELDLLVDTLNRMVDELRVRMEEAMRRRDEEAALFSCMIEGVLAVDMQKRVIKLNRSLAATFGIAMTDFSGRHVLEVVRSSDLLALIDRAMEGTGTVEAAIQLEEPERHLQAHGTLIRDGAGREMGVLIVISDVTRMRRLEAVRRDFVANVSHELKTPITSIKGFAETLLEGAGENAVDRERFLRIIAKQADRLHSIVNDILALSSIENGDERNAIELQCDRLLPVLQNAVQSSQGAAQAKGIGITLECSADVQVRMNAPLIEQAVSNLLDNAIKYSGEGTPVEVSVCDQAGEICIRVADRGPGIGAEHVPRLFERFYRVDKGRSRKQGGTGLGLAIVKRVAIAHRGRVDVQTELGKGSTFTIYLPNA